MQTYCVSCKINAGNKDAKVIKIKNGRLQMKSLCSICGNKKKHCKRTRNKRSFIKFGN